MAIRDQLIKEVQRIGGNSKNIVTIADGVRELASYYSFDDSSYIKDAHNIEMSLIAYYHAKNNSAVEDDELIIDKAVPAK